MERELMEKEVLCILDTRQIQRFMFRSNSFLDTIGGSDLLDHVLWDAIRDAMTHIDTPLREEEYALSLEPEVDAIPYFTSTDVKFQLIICSAGNALCIVRSGALCQKTIRRISRYYLEKGYSLNLAATATEKTDNLGRDIFNLYKKLNNIKAASDISDPLGTLPVIMRENRTGEPVVAFDEEYGDYVSMSSVIRRKEAKQRKVQFDLKDIRTTRTRDGKDYFAYVHADGNNLGITIGRILQTTSDYIEGIITRRKLNRNIEMAYAAVVDNSIRDLKEYYLKNGGEEKDFPYEFQIFHRAGDDINLVCNASLVFPFLDFFYQNLSGATIWEKGDERIPLYVCAGIAFVTADSTFHGAYGLAEQCCKSAKTSAKEGQNLLEGLAGNWIDFQVCDNPNVQELDMLRERSYHTAEGINLMLRPYSRDEVDRQKDYYYGKLIQRVKKLKEIELSKEQMDVLKQSYLNGRIAYGQWIRNMKEEGIDLVAELGAPAYTDFEQKTHAVWFDAVELMDFIPDT